jgi:hypothetical protein
MFVNVSYRRQIFVDEYFVKHYFVNYSNILATNNTGTLSYPQKVFSGTKSAASCTCSAFSFTPLGISRAAPFLLSRGPVVCLLFILLLLTSSFSFPFLLSPGT